MTEETVMSKAVSETILEVKGIKKRFGETEVLKGIDFSVEKGEVVAIIGSSGSGKTTLLRCLNFLEFSDEGTISVNGETLYDGAAERSAKKKIKNNDKLLRKKRLHFGLVFQNFNLFPHKSVMDNLLLAPTLQFKSELRAAKKAEKQAAKRLKKVKTEEEKREIEAWLAEKTALDYRTLDEIKEKAALEAFLKAHGCDATADEFLKFAKPADEGELNDESAGQVTGGGLPWRDQVFR